MRFSQPIVLFALVSGGVHAAALALSPLHSAIALAPGQPATSLQVRLTTSSAARASLPRPQVKETQPQNKTVALSRSDRQVTQTSHRSLTALTTSQKIPSSTTNPTTASRTETVTDSTPQAPAKRQPNEAIRAAALSAASLANRRNHIRTRLQHELATFFRYPYMARRRGWHGRVVLGVSIMPSGQISRVAVQHSSGHPVLDEAALSAMHRITKLDWAPALLQGDAVKIELPVIYRLLGG